MVKIKLVLGDITQIRADAIVNSAHSSLNAGSGVSGAIHRAAGPELAKECRKIIDSLGRELSIGEAVKTKPYKLSENGVKFIIHTLAPRSYANPMSDLWFCYENSFELAKENGCKTLAFPAIATGAHGLSIEKSARYVRRFLMLNFKGIDEFIFVLSNKKDKEIYEKIILPLNESKETLDFAEFCAVCLGPISSCPNHNVGGRYCSEKCENLQKVYSKTTDKDLDNLLSEGLRKQRLKTDLNNSN